jgi:hypothetical protein
MKRHTIAAVVAALTLLSFVRSAGAVYHLVLIDEVMTSYSGDATVQFVELRMLASLQNLVAHAIFAAFDADGSYIGDILEVPSNVATANPDVRWIIGTSQFQTVSGLTPDFIMPAGVLPTGGGMVCYGAPPSFIGTPQNPPTWDRTNFANYADCLAYGTYSGSTNALIGTPTSLDGDGHTLQRVLSTHNNENDFLCGNPATPQNNAGASVTLPATTPCTGCTATPDGACVSGFAKGSLQIKEAVGKESLQAKMIGGPALAQTDLGNPLSGGGTAYDVCIYNGSGNLVGKMSIARAGDTCSGKPCWKALGGDPPSGKGYKYKDDALAASGTFQILYKGGMAGKSKALVKGRGAGLPDNVADGLLSSTSATVQLRGSNAPKCLSLTVTDIKKQDANNFKANK